MNKNLYKVFSLFTILALLLVASPVQLSLAAGEPAAPSQLDAQPGYPGDLSVSLTWLDNSTDETVWEIERCLGAGCSDFTLYATRDATVWGAWFTDVGLAESTTYTYRVRALNAFGASGYSNIASAATSYARPDGWVSNLLGSFVNGAVELSWSENATNETRLEIERYEINSGEPAFSVIASLAPDATSYVDTTALRGTSYLYRVTLWRFDVYGGASDAITIETGAGIPAPTNVRAAASSSTAIRLTWKGRFEAGTQVVVQRENCDLYGCYGWLTVGQVAASTGRFTDTGLAPVTSYNYRLRAVSSTSVSPFTATLTATTRR